MMRSTTMLVVLVLASGLATAQTVSAQTPRSASPQFAIVSPERVRCVELQPCLIALRTSDGRPPLRWRLVRGKIPDGMTLDPASGRITGIPAAPGQTTVFLEAIDSSSPQQRTERRLIIDIQSILDVEWEKPPALTGTNLSGTLRVVNYSGNEVMLTVVVVAVNEIGKAFTLGYQHFSMAPGATSPVIPFGMQLPPGRYRVRADAVGEVAAKNIIYRSAVQAGPFATP